MSIVVAYVLLGVWALGIGAVFRILTKGRRSTTLRSLIVRGTISLAWPLVCGFILGQLIYFSTLGRAFQQRRTTPRLKRYRDLMLRVYNDDSLTLAQKRVLYKVITESGKKHIWPPAIVPTDGTSPVITLEALGYEDEILKGMRGQS